MNPHRARHGFALEMRRSGAVAPDALLQGVDHNNWMLLGEWRAWWKASGEQQLRDLLRENWDPFADPSFRVATDDQLLPLARRLHEGATLVDVQTFLHDLRRTRWPERMGRKWTSRDHAVARKVVAWYWDATDEQPVKE